MEKLRAPQAISFGAADLAHEWRKWRKQFELYFQAAELSKKAKATQVAILLNVAGTEAQEIYDAFVFTAGDEGPAVGDVSNKFDDYCNPRKNEVFERHQFWSRDRHEDETIDRWLTELRTKAATYGFGDQKDELTRDKIVFGVRDGRVKERLLREANLTLQSALDICRAAETSTYQAKMMTRDATRVEIDSMSRSSQRTCRPIPTKAAEKAWKAKKTAPCEYCGGYHAPRQCPAYGETCVNCHKCNQLSKVCQQGAKSGYKRSKAVNSSSEAADTQIDTDDSDDSLLMGVLAIGTVAVNDGRTEKLSLGPTTMKLKLDTGARANVLPYRSYRRILRTTGGSRAIKKPLTSTKRVLVGIGGGKIRPRGITTIECTVKSRRIQATNCLSFYVTDEDIAILGSRACQEMNLVKKIGSLKPAHGQTEAPSKSSKEGPIDRYHDVFKGSGSYERSYLIRLKEDAVPVIQPARKYPYAKRQRLEQALRRC